MVAPMCVPVLLVLAGTLAGCVFPGARDLYLGGLLSGGVLSLGALVLGRRPATRLLPLALCLFLAGASRTSVRLNPRLPPGHLAHRVGAAPLFLEGVLREPPRCLGGWTRLPLECRAVREAGGASRVSGRVDLALDGCHPGFRAGDVLLVRARVRRVEAPGNPGPMNGRTASFLRGVYVKGNVQKPGHVHRLVPAREGAVERALEGVRRGVREFLGAEASPRTEGLLRVWLLGDRSRMPGDMVEDFRASGLAHLLALSGLHVGMVFLFWYGCWRWVLGWCGALLLRGGVQKPALALSLPGVLFYVALAGSPLTAVRAGWMAALAAGALILGRSPARWNALGAAALFLVMAEPGALLSPSFLLSFVTVAALMIGAGGPRPGGEPAPAGGAPAAPLARAVRRGLRGVRALAVVSGTSCLAVAPLTALFFHTVTPLSVGANLLAVPVVCWLVLPLAMVLGGLCAVWTPGARMLLCLEEAGVGLVAETARLFAGAPGACLRCGAPSLVEIVCYYAVLAAVLHGGRRALGRPLVLACAAVFAVSVACGCLGPRTRRDLTVTFLSVGSGDAALVEFPGGRRALLDGGPARRGAFDAGERIVAPFLGAKRCRRVDALVVSHGQADHYGGLRYVLAHFRPAAIWTPPETGKEEAGYRAFLLDGKRLGAARLRLCRGCMLPEVSGVRLEVLHPACGRGGAGGVNDASLVLCMTYGAVRFLFTGDIERGAEAALLDAGLALEATVLKVPHHGSATSSTEAFLDRVRPRVAVISSGSGNRFGFPSERVVDRYRRRGVCVYRTALDGAVQVVTDGRSLRVRGHRTGRERVFRVGPLCPGRAGPSAQVAGAAHQAEAAREQQQVRARQERDDPEDGPDGEQDEAGGLQEHEQQDGQRQEHVQGGGGLHGRGPRRDQDLRQRRARQEEGDHQEHGQAPHRVGEHGRHEVRVDDAGDGRGEDPERHPGHQEGRHEGGEHLAQQEVPAADRRGQERLQGVALPLAGEAVRGDDARDQEGNQQEERDADDLDGEHGHLLDVRVPGQAGQVGLGHVGEHHLDLVQVVHEEAHVEVDEQHQGAHHGQGQEGQDAQDVVVAENLAPLLARDQPGLSHRPSPVSPWIRFM